MGRLGHGFFVDGAIAAFVCLLVAAGVVAPVGAAGAGATDGAAIARALETRAVVLAGSRVDGDVQLGATVRHTFVCDKCVIQGDVVAPVGAKLERGINLTGSTISGRLELAGATISRGFVAHGAVFDGIVNLRGTTVRGGTDLSEAAFHSLFLADSNSGATNPPTMLGEGADFSLASFSNLATFGNVDFTRGADFDLAKFDSNAVFASATFGKPDTGGEASFARTIFAGPVDFSSATVWGTAGFTDAEFQDRADFTDAIFVGPAAFDRASFVQGATFRGSTFQPLKKKDCSQDSIQDSFQSVSSGGNLNFNYATFWATDFSGIDVADTISFEDSTVPKDDQFPKCTVPKLSFSQATAGRFVMRSDDALSSVAGADRTLVLQMIESSAAKANDLGTANDAHYARLELESHNEWWGLRVLNAVFYRGIAGYLVRPLHPVVALVALAVLVTLARVIYHGAGNASAKANALEEPPVRAHRRALAVERRFRTSFATTLSLIGPKRGDDKEREGRQLEILTFRVLVACALIGFANSNPTLRQMLDAI
jgi:Pentapeptide repeats (9 copies)